jgi:rhamnosyltransferase
MSTYNGEKYLTEQIDSILAQKGVHVELFIRDDGSTDKTREIISDYTDRFSNIHAEFGNNMGWIRSFIYALGATPEFDYYAMADQDDVWIEHKLITAIKSISQEESVKGKDIPVIWQSNLYVTDQNLNIIYKTQQEKRLTTIQSLAIRPSGRGCTMVMNAKAREFSRHKNQAELFSYRGYDISLILLTVASGGRFILEREALMKYRQHGHNVSGVPVSMIKRIKHEYTRFTQWYGRESRFAKIMLQYFGDEMTQEAKKVFTLVAGSKDNWTYRLKMFFSPKFRTGDFRATLIEKFRILFGLL